MAYNMKRGNSAVPFRELGSSPAKHGDKDPGGHKDVAVHKAWHKKHGFEKTGPAIPGKPESGTLTSWKRTLPTERDFSEHNIAARETEGTIEEQEERRKNPPPKYKSPTKQKGKQVQLSVHEKKKGTMITGGSKSEIIADLEDRIEFLRSDLKGGSTGKPSIMNIGKQIAKLEARLKQERAK